MYVEGGVWGRRGGVRDALSDWRDGCELGRAPRPGARAASSTRGVASFLVALSPIDVLLSYYMCTRSHCLGP